MRCLRLLLVCVAFSAVSAAANPGIDWLPITPSDLHTNPSSLPAGSPAVQLYYADEIDDQNHTEFFYYRIKILNENGKRYANAEIAIYPETKLRDLQARTIRPDGSIVELTAAPFEKVVVKTRGVKVMAKELTFPEANVGAIIEYKFTIQHKHFVGRYWVLEHELFTVKQHFVFKFGKTTDVSFTASGTKAQPVRGKDAFELELENTPAFEPEEQMPPPDSYKATIRFTYGQSGGWNNFYWGLTVNSWGRYFDAFIGDRKEIHEASAEAIGKATNPDAKLRLLYARAQQIKNLSYGTGESDRKDLKEAKNIADVLKHGYGTRQEIAVLFVALARAAGFNANVVLATDRSRRFYPSNTTHPDQYDFTLVAVEVNGKDVFLDPGTRFCPFGLRRWSSTSTPAVKLQRFGASFFDLPASKQDQAVIYRLAEIGLNEAGDVHGSVSLRFEGSEALDRRLLAIETDDAGRKKALEEEMKQWLPAQAAVTMIGAEGWEDESGPLVADFKIDLPAFATAAGKRLLVPTVLFQAKQEATFQSAVRKYPVYFPYAFSEFDAVTIQLPEGTALENSPSPLVAEFYWGDYQNTTNISGTKIIATRNLVLKRHYFDPSGYSELKRFFDQVRVGDELHAVLNRDEKKPETANTTAH